MFAGPRFNAAIAQWRAVTEGVGEQSTEPSHVSRPQLPFLAELKNVVAKRTSHGSSVTTAKQGTAGRCNGGPVAVAMTSAN